MTGGGCQPPLAVGAVLGGAVLGGGGRAASAPTPGWRSRCRSRREGAALATPSDATASRNAPTSALNSALISALILPALPWAP